MGAAERWQDRVVKDLEAFHVTILNPRREDWDSTWEQSIDNAKFKEQVDWELSGLLSADVVLFYFDPATKSPITLLELGLMAGQKKAIVCCPKGFYRKGNVDIVCDLFNVPLVESLLVAIEGVKRLLIARTRFPSPEE